MDFPPFAVTVDLVVLTVRGDELCVLLVRRGVEPFAGQDALPGGFIRPEEDLAAAAARELVEETGLTVGHLEQLASYGAPDRDPRQRVVTVAHLALVPDQPAPTAGTDAEAARWAPVAGLSGLAFDHDRVLADGVERARAKLEYSALGTAFCPPSFTVAQLRRVYEVVWGRDLDPRNFHRKVTGTAGLLEPTGETTTRDGGRPAQLYRRGPADTLHPPLLRTDA
ncbi:NUDIX hydrolase [Geodermatophilus sp. Leaf369]|uniref:NUDIX hydrolase n=1 Tax=Geodermatophilus sp. Leaf369 TaxID=1736354 RepID=UPI0006FC97C8|nr:NUDIX domain-containing protein [Geodermatophilus sp. Leaf369]KQS58336.1 NUDIX hydrolase [Geodermatophilus sp. Leaf369]